MDATLWFCQRFEGMAHIFDLDTLPMGLAESPLHWPDVNGLDLDQIGLNYYERYDLLSVYFGGRPVPAVNMPLEAPDSEFGYAEARLGIPNGEVVGIEITGYRSEVSRLHPRWANLPALTGAERRRALFDLISAVAAMPVYDGPPNS
jgi:hypothetical protein